MKHYIQQAFPGMTSGRIDPVGGEAGGTLVSVFCRTLLSLLLLVLVSNTVFADHFRGGHFSYKSLGEGKYEFLIKGYWHKSYVGTVYLRCEGKPKIHGFPVTLSKTLLPDGETVEHIQKYTVTWAVAGSYDVYWENCCRGSGANFEGNKKRLFAVVNYDPAVPSSSPKFYDYFNLNFTTGQPITYRINMEDPDGHEPEYSLEIPFDLATDAYAKMLETGFQLKQDGTIVWEKPLAGKWAINIRLNEKINGNFTGGYVDREYMINVSSDSNKAPVYTPVQAKAVRAGESLSFDIEAYETEGQNVALTANGSSFEKGAGFIQTMQGTLAKGTFSWTPPAGVIGTYQLQFVATDNASTPLSAYLNVAITVAECTEFAANYSIKAQPCAGSSNGKITLNTTEGFSPYLYSLDNGLTYQSSPDFGNLATDTYIAVIKDAIGCISEPVFIALEEAPLPEVSLNLPVAVCANAAALTLNGGSPAGGNYEGTAVVEGSFYPANAGVGTHIIYYTFIDNNGCSNTTSAEIIVKETPVADSEAADTVVYSGAGARACTTIAADATAGTAPYTYQWSTGEIDRTIEVCPAETTTYLVTVTDAAGCSDTSQITISVQEPGNSGGNRKKPDWAGEGKPDHAGGGKSKRGIAGGATMADHKAGAVDFNLLAQIPTEEVIVFPNPVTRDSRLFVRLLEADNITVEVLDLTGRVVKILYAGSVEAREELSFELYSQLGKEKFYMVRVTNSKEVYTLKLIR